MARAAHARSASLSSEVYRLLRAELMEGKIPPWERLSEIPLAERFEVSRTPVREALSRLESDGLLIRRNGSLCPYVPDYGELIGLYDLRITLELTGIGALGNYVIPRPDDAAHALLRQEESEWSAFRVTPPALDSSFVRVDESFHIALIHYSGNKALVDALRQVNDRIRSVRMFDYLTDDRMAATIDEHLAILNHINHDDFTHAHDILAEHIVTARDYVLGRVSAAYGRQP